MTTLTPPRRRLWLGSLWLLLTVVVLSMTGGAFGQPPVDFVCPPCGHECLRTSYPAPGICPVCSMELVERSSLSKDSVDSVFQFSYEDVVVHSTGVELEARFYLPEVLEEPLAAVVINHGSAPTTFRDVSFYVAAALDGGLAALAYSKRGCGRSGGTFRRFTVKESPMIFEELAQDAAAALRWVKSRPEVDPMRAGYLGGSQAGWINPLADSKERGAFIINVAGASVTAGMEQYHGQLVGDGVESQRRLSTLEADQLVSNYKGPHGYDPRPLLRNLSTNTLWIFGDQDQAIPVQPSIDEIERLIQQGNSHHFVLLAPGVDHNMKNVEGDGSFDLASAIASWLRKRAILPIPPTEPSEGKDLD